MFPAARAAAGLATRVMLSTTGWKERAACSMMLCIVVAGAARTQARSLGCFCVEQFRDETRESHELVELVPTPMMPAKVAVPLSRIAALKGGLWGIEVTSASTDKAPADSPNIVTLDGSPPKDRMLCWTHVRAALWSRKPRFWPVTGSCGELGNPKTENVSCYSLLIGENILTVCPIISSYDNNFFKCRKVRSVIAWLACGTEL